MQRNIVGLIAVTAALWLLLIASGCNNGEVERILERTDALMQSQPDSALAMLRRVDVNGLSGELKARHALLTAQALDKNYIDVPADSIADIALRYYQNCEDYPRERMMAYYYKANARYNAGDYNNAIYYLFISDTLAIQRGDNGFRVLTNGLLAHCFSGLVDQSHEIEYSSKAREACELAGDTIHMGNAKIYEAACYAQFKMYDKALELLSDSLCGEEQYTRAKCYVGLKRYDDYLRIVGEYPKLRKKVKLQSLYAQMLLDDGRVAEAGALLDSINGKFNDYFDSIHWAAAQMKRLRMSGDYRGAYDMLEKSISTHLHSYNVRLASYQHSSRLRADEYLASLAMESEQVRRHRTELLLIVTVAAAIIAGLVASMEVRRRRQRLELRMAKLVKYNSSLVRQRREQWREMSRLRQEKDAWEKRTQELTRLVEDPEGGDELDDEEFVSSGIARLDRLAADYDAADDSRMKRQLRGKIERQLRALRSREMAERIDRLVNLTHDNLMTRVASLRLNRNELTLLRYMAAGFDRRHVELLMDVNHGTLNTRKSRLRARLAEAGIHDVAEL